MKLDDHSIIAWLYKNQIKTETGHPYDLASHFFWYDVLRDWTPEQVWFKAAQVGGTTVAILKTLWGMNKFGINSAYTMPTGGDARDFVTGKMNPLIDQNPVLKKYTEDRDTVSQKRIGDNTLYIRGTWTTRQALSFSSDLNIHDEIDRSDQSVVDQYASRQQHSEYKWTWKFSNPSTVGNGVDKAWKKSDQKHWIITCPHCEQKQFLSWPDSIDMERKAYVCKKCRKILPDKARAHGFWNPMADGDVSGYWISLLMASWIPASYIIKQYEEKSADFFYNFVLGLPYEGPGGKITEDQFFSNLDSEPYAIENPIVIGLDTGLPNWFVIGTRQGLVGAGQCEGYDEIEMMLDRWPKAILVCDQGGDLIKPRELREKYPGRVFLCYYRNDRKTVQLIQWGKNEESGKVVVDRNRMIQLLMDEWKTQRLPLKGRKEDWWQLWTHISNMYRVVEENRLGVEQFSWQRSGDDHLCHAALYCRVGLAKFGKATERHVGGVATVLEHLPKTAKVDPITNTMPFTSVVDKPHDPRDI